MSTCGSRISTRARSRGVSGEQAQQPEQRRRGCRGCRGVRIPPGAQAVVDVRRPVGLRPDLHGADRAVRHLRRRVPGLRRHGRPGLRDRHARHGVHRGVVLADGARLPGRRLGLHLRGAGYRAARRLPHRLDGAARLRAGAGSALPDRGDRDELDRAGRPGLAVDRGVRRAQHGGQLLRHRDDRADQQADADRGARRTGDLPGDRRGRARERGRPRLRPQPALRQQHVLARARLRRGFDRRAELPRLRRCWCPPRSG